MTIRRLNRKILGRHIAWILIVTSVLAGGCIDDHQSRELPAQTAAKPGTEQELDHPDTAHVAVGDDPAVSLAKVADEVLAAIERFDKVEQLVRPKGWNRQRMAVLLTNSAVDSADADGPVQGTIRVTMQSRFSEIRPTRDEAANDDQLLARRPMPSHDEMLNDRSNPELKPVELVVRYEVRNGHWVRTSWEVPLKQALGGDWLEVIGAP